jgi:hypothetical protein
MGAFQGAFSNWRFHISVGNIGAYDLRRAAAVVPQDIIRLLATLSPVPQPDHRSNNRYREIKIDFRVVPKPVSSQIQITCFRELLTLSRKPKRTQESGHCTQHVRPRYFEEA